MSEQQITPRHYRTASGSTATASGRFGFAYSIDFDWFEEGACIEAEPTVERDTDGLRLEWSCACCEGGGAALQEIACHAK